MYQNVHSVQEYLCSLSCQQYIVIWLLVHENPSLLYVQLWVLRTHSFHSSTQMQYEYYRHTLQFADTTLILVCTLNEFILWHTQHPLEYTCIYNRLSDSSICSGDPIFHTLITQPLFRSQFHTQVFLFTY